MQLCYKDPRFSSKKCLWQGLHCTQEVRKSCTSLPALESTSFIFVHVHLWCAAVDAILHSFKNALGCYLENNLGRFEDTNLQVCIMIYTSISKLWLPVFFRGCSSQDEFKVECTLNSELFAHWLFEHNFNKIIRQCTACFMQLSTPLNTALFTVQKSSQPQPPIHAERMRAARAAAPWTPSTDWLSRCCEPWKRDRSSTQLPRVALCCEPLKLQQLKNSVLKVAWSGL